jgi:hypothetical protein
MSKGAKVNSWSIKHQKELKVQKAARVKRYVVSPLSFLAGCVFTLLSNQWLAPLLPGPQAGVSLTGLRATSGNASGCTAYNFTLFTDESIESTYLKIALPQNIKSIKVGLPAGALVGQSISVSMPVWELGRGAGGECEIVGSTVNIDQSVSAVASANVLTVRTSKMAGKSTVVGVLAVPSYDSAMLSNQPIFEGNYEYTKWGLSVRRKLSFDYQGIQDFN